MTHNKRIRILIREARGYALIMLPLILLAYLLFSDLFIYHTIADSLDAGEVRGREITKRQYGERERELTRESVLQLVSAIEHGVRLSPKGGGALEEEILGMVRTDNFGLRTDRGYFLFDGNDICIFSNDFPSLVGETREDFLPLFAELRKNGGTRFIEYDLPLYETPGQGKIKTACLAPIPSLGWIAGAGFFWDVAESQIGEQEELWGEIRHTILSRVTNRILVFSFFMFLFITAAVLLILSSGLKREAMQSQFGVFKKAMEDNLCVLYTDDEGRITWVNDKFLSLTGRTEEALLGRSYLWAEAGDLSEDQRRELKERLGQGKSWHGLVRGRDRGGANFWLQAQIGSVADEKGRITGYTVFSQDVTDIYRRQHELEKSFYTDTLTGCGNRPKLMTVYEMESGFYVAMYNIDGFSGINRFYGMEEGDRVLIMVADSLREHLDSRRESLYRIQADTFVILSKGWGEEEFLARSLERWHRLGQLTVNFNESLIPLSFRMGVSTYSSDSLVIAESALNGAKNSSDGYVHYSDSQSERSQGEMEELDRLNNIRMALNRSDLFLVYQPIMDLKKGTVNKYECLVRIRDGEGQLINPDNFISLAKKGRLYKRITHLVIEQSFAAFGEREEEFSINLTIEDFMNGDTLEFLLSRAAHYRIADRLIVEIVETEELRDFSEIINIIGRLKERGIRIAIDDFGSGFSNFSYLLKLNADFIKIDGSIMRSVLSDDKSQTLVQSIIQFARKSGIATIGEYIEGEELKEYAREAGIDFAQGYLIGKPSPELPPR